jgi:hypothetical protein
MKMEIGTSPVCSELSFGHSPCHQQFINVLDQENAISSRQETKPSLLAPISISIASIPPRLYSRASRTSSHRQPNKTLKPSEPPPLAETPSSTANVPHTAPTPTHHPTQRSHPIHRAHDPPSAPPSTYRAKSGTLAGLTLLSGSPAIFTVLEQR